MTPPIEKYPQDHRTYIFDLSEVEEIVAGASLVSAVVTAEGVDDELDVAAATVSGHNVLCVISGGTAEVVYTLTLVATLSGSTVYTDKAPLIVLA